MMDFRYIGEFAALATAGFWTASSQSFEAATKRVGADAVNITRMVTAMLFLIPTAGVVRGIPLPFDATQRQWLWLSLSGLVGYTLGDYFLFRAFEEVGSRISMLVMASSPAIAAALGFLAFGEEINLVGIFGMAFIAAGICIVVVKRKDGGFAFNHPIQGIVFAFGGAVGQAGGYILSKYGMQLDGGKNYSVLASSQIRLLSGTLGFVVLYFIMKKWSAVRSGLTHRQGMSFTVLGAATGPFIGVGLSLFAVQHTKVGIASTLSSITPILILPFAARIFKEKIGLLDVLGACSAVIGVALMFL